jgi:hypothetical protein
MLRVALINSKIFFKEVGEYLDPKRGEVPVVLYGCETWSLTLREELRMFENRVLRRISEPKRDEETGG